MNGPRPWFDVQLLSPGLWQLTEPGHVCSWLVVGSERAALIDSGCGISPIRPVVETITGLPVTVVNTHHHFDHVGGNSEWAEIAIHESGVDALSYDVAPDILHAYLRYTREMITAFERYAELDRRFFHLLRDADVIRALPDGFDDMAWRVPGTRATASLREGDTIDLGGRSLRVLHTPGHSPDCLCLELVGERILIGGDTVNTGPVYAQLPESDLAAFAASLRRLADESPRWDVVHCSHFLRTQVAPGYLAEQADAFERLTAGDVALGWARDCIGREVREARFDGFSVLLAAA